MNRTSARVGLVLVFLLESLLAAGGGAAQDRAPAATPPNFVIILTDDQGWADVGCFGAKKIATPHLDRMAQEGLRLTDFYATPACTSTRAAFLTGCYAPRTSLPWVVYPRNKIGLNPDEITIAEVLKPRGYATACIGKWHVGRPEPFLPTSQGFDHYYGIPYSHDMSPLRVKRKPPHPPVPLLRGTEVEVENPDPASLTGRYTDEAVKFIRKHAEQPFFLYLAHSLPHVPLGASEAFRGKSAGGPYGDVIEEIDASVGRILATLKSLDLDERTLVVFTSDNGPWLNFGDHAGSAGPLREGKGTTFEGGIRVPCIARWPGQVPADLATNRMASIIDLLPTVADLAGADVPKDRVIDGKSLRKLLTDPNRAKSPHLSLFFFRNRGLEAVRAGRWKLHVPHTYRSLEGRKPGKGGKPVRYTYPKTPLALYDLARDPGETKNLAKKHPGVVKRLLAEIERAREDLGDKHTKRKGKGVRAVGSYGVRTKLAR